VKPVQASLRFRCSGHISGHYAGPERVTRNKKIRMCKVQWSHHTEEEAAWEGEEELKAKFPSFVSDPSESRGRDSF
jgi:hypothetical protein